MSVPSAKNLNVVEGEIVSQSVVKLLGLLLAAVLCIPAGGWIVWAWWTEASWLGHQFTLAAGLIGLFMLVGGLFGVPASVVVLLFGQRLILGKDCLQLATKKGRVLTQIPYRNIAQLELVSEPGKEKYIGIDLRDLNDTDTFNVGDAASKSLSGWHYRITAESWSMPVPQIYEHLRKRLPL